MAIPVEKAAELRVKQLEMVQAVIARIAGYGATLKNYCITLTTAICGLAITLQRPLVALLSLMPIIVFALLDAQFLRTERRFRGLFDRIRKGDWSALPDFEIGLRNAPRVRYWPVLASWSISVFYLPLAIGVVLVVIATGSIYGRYF